MSKITTWIAKIAQDQEFGWFMAHAGFACSVILLAKGSYWVALAILIFAGLKEFWFDMKYEDNPPQTFMDSLDDFTGYLVGIVIAVAAAHLI